VVNVYVSLVKYYLGKGTKINEATVKFIYYLS